MGSIGSWDSSSDVGGVRTLARADDVDAMDDTEALLATDGVGDGLLALLDERGEAGVWANGKPKPEKRRSMLSRGDSASMREAFCERAVGGEGAGRGA